MESSIAKETGLPAPVLTVANRVPSSGAESGSGWGSVVAANAKLAGRSGFRARMAYGGRRGRLKDRPLDDTAIHHQEMDAVEPCRFDAENPGPDPGQGDPHRSGT